MVYWVTQDCLGGREQAGGTAQAKGSACTGFPEQDAPGQQAWSGEGEGGRESSETNAPGGSDHSEKGLPSQSN